MRIVWVMKKQLDVALDRSVRIEMINALGRLGHEVTFVTGYRDSTPDYGLGPKLRYVRSSNVPGLNHATFISALKGMLPGLVREQQPDVVVLDAWTVECARLVREAATQTPVVIADVRTLPVNQSGIRGAAVERSFRRGIRAMSVLDGVAVITPAMHEVLVARWGLDAALPWGVWSSGVDLERFRPGGVDAEQRALLRSRIADEDAFVVMYHGAITRQRGVGELVRAVGEARPASGREVRLLLLGDGRDRADILAEAQAAGFASAVVYVPPVANAEVPGYIAAADVGAIPLPDLEGWRVSSPIKLLEYWAAGKPVVLTDIEAHRFAAQGSLGAFVAPSADADGLRAAIEAAADAPGSELEAAGRAGRMRVEQEFGWDAQAARFAEFLGGLRPSRGSRG